MSCHVFPFRTKTEMRGAGPGVARLPLTTPSMVVRYRATSTEPVWGAVTFAIENVGMVGRLARYCVLVAPLPSARSIWKAGERNRSRPLGSLLWTRLKNRFTSGVAVATGCVRRGAARTAWLV